MNNVIIIIMLFLFGYLPMHYCLVNEIKIFLGFHFVAAFIAIILSGFFSPGLPAFFITIFIIFVATARGRRFALGQYILLAGLVVQVPYGVSVAGHFLGFIDPLAVLGLAAYLLSRFSDGLPAPYLRSLTVEDGLVAVAFLIMAIGGTGLPDFFSVVRALNTQALLIAVPYLVIRFAARSSNEYRNMIACFGVSGFLLAVFALYEAHYGWSIFQGINHHLGTNELSKNILRRGDALRAPATMAGPLALACYLTVSLMALVCSRDYFKVRWGYYGAIGVTFLGLLAAQSRGSLPALALALVVLCMAWRRFGLAFLAIGAVGVMGGVLYAVAQVSASVAAFLQINQPRAFGEYADYRQLLLERGIDEAMKHPWIGLRLQPVLDALADITQGQHIVDLVNIYLVILLISGMLGFIPFISLLLSSIFKTATGFKSVQNRDILNLRAFCLAALVTVLIQFSFMSFIDRIPMNFVMILAGMRLVRLDRAYRGNAHSDQGKGTNENLTGRAITARELATRLGKRTQPSAAHQIDSG